MRFIYLLLVLSNDDWIKFYSSDNAITDNYSITFKAIKEEGTFQRLSGKIIFNPDDLKNSNLDVSVEVSSIQTGNEKKDGHAKVKKWFHIE